MAKQGQKLTWANKKDKLIHENNNTHNAIESKAPYEANLCFK